jgi:predicted ABC-class ATPase
MAGRNGAIPVSETQRVVLVRLVEQAHPRAEWVLGYPCFLSNRALKPRHAGTCTECPGAATPYTSPAMPQKREKVE